MMTRLLKWLPLDVVIACLALAAIYAATAIQFASLVHESEARAVDAATRVAESNALLLSVYWEDMQRRIDRLQVLARAVTLAQQRGDQVAVADAMATLQLAMPLSGANVLAVVGVSMDGTVSWTSGGDVAGAMALNQKEHISGALTDGLERFVSLPELDPRSGHRRIFFSSAQRDASGLQVGVGEVVFDLARAEALQHQIIHYEHDIVMLMRARDSILLRSDGLAIGKPVPAGPVKFGPSLTPGFLFRRAVSEIDGVLRLVVLRYVPNSNLSIVVGVDEANALQDVREYEARAYMALAFAAVALTLFVVGCVIGWRKHRLDQTQRMDVTAWKARNDLLQEIAAQSNDAIGVFSADWRYLFANNTVAKLIGRNVDEIINQPVVQILSDEHHADLIKNLALYTKTQKAFRITAPIRTPDGVEAWFEYDISDIKLPTQYGEARNGWFFIGRDITARKIAENELQRAHDYLRAIAENVPGMLYRTMVDDAGETHFEYTSAKDGKVLGFDEADWRQPNFTVLRCHPDDEVARRKMIDELRSTGQAIGEYRLMHRDGHYVWVRNYASMLIQNDKTFLVSGYVTDITIEKEQKRKLEDARRMLNLGDLASGVGHELGQPLMGIDVAAKIGLHALSHPMPDLQLVEAKFARIVAMTERASAIIDTMRTLGRGEMGAKTWTSLRDVVDEALNATRDRVAREHVTVVVDVPDLPKVLVSTLLFEQVVVNLLTNACDAYRDAPQGGSDQPRTIHITGRQEGEQIFLTVADRAGGVPPEYVGRLFEPFFTTKAPGKGTGLGLSVCYGVVRQASGNLTVHNAGGGAVFEIVLPVLPESDLGMR